MSSCGCSSGCKCSSGCGCNGCGCCKRNADFGEEKGSTAQIMILGVAPQKGGFEDMEMGAEAENGGCKCGSNCTCNTCTCK